MCGEWRTDPDDWEAQDDYPVLRSSEGHWLSLTRRGVLKGGLGLAAVFVGGCAVTGGARPRIGFTPLPAQTDPGFDAVRVPAGYRAVPFYSWGDPIDAEAPRWRADAGNDWRDQLRQAGDNHDGMHYFPFADNPNGHGLLVINHEKVATDFLHPRGATVLHDEQGRPRRPDEEVNKELAAHGVSVIEIAKDRDGQWRRIMTSSYNRRISGLTPMILSGPAAGAEAMRTASDPTGRRVIGTFANCALGYTPWGTYLACEENWPNYFVNRDAEDYQRRPQQARYRLSQGERSNYYLWETAQSRFDATPDRSLPHQGEVNEPNRFGWVVEIDPFDPDSTPVKRTAMGRLVRECATPSLADDGRMAFYFGDDTRGEYIYKFVPRDRYRADDPAANRELLDHGTLYVAVFHDDGRGEWRPLRHGQGPLNAANGFPDQAAVLINARGAADLLGATRMDRPEWVAVRPGSREVYVTLTNNDERGVDDGQPVNAANPRPRNLHGQILRWRERDNDPAATVFDWELFLLAGYPAGGEAPAHQWGTIQGDVFSSPDGLWFDPAGRLWIETDYDDESPDHQAMGTNQLLCADPDSGEVRRFLVGPRGCEITGITGTPDGRTLWVNVQHPGISYPASDGHTRPRSTTVLITRDDGGEIGT
ncbi:MAG: PhoX family phosphatase [Alloalcanivorax xenomutans]